MGVKKLLHTRMRVNDLERTVRFYEHALGLTVARRSVSPRGAQALVLAAKGHALLAGRYNVSFEDIRAVLSPVLRHRFQLNYEGEAEGIDAAALIVRLLDTEIRKAA